MIEENQQIKKKIHFVIDGFSTIPGLNWTLVYWNLFIEKRLWKFRIKLNENRNMTQSRSTFYIEHKLN